MNAIRGGNVLQWPDPPNFARSRMSPDWATRGVCVIFVMDSVFLCAFLTLDLHSLAGDTHALIRPCSTGVKGVYTSGHGVVAWTEGMAEPLPAYGQPGRAALHSGIDTRTKRPSWLGAHCSYTGAPTVPLLRWKRVRRSPLFGSERSVCCDTRPSIDKSRESCSARY